MELKVFGGTPRQVGAAVTYANPQAEPGRLWVARPQVDGTEVWSAFDL